MPTIQHLLQDDSPLLMGVLNVTSDSFYDGGAYLETDSALRQAEAMLAVGADIIDVGGESTRPGAQTVSSSEEIDRVAPVVEQLVSKLSARVALDTSNPELMRTGVGLGAQMINDVRALQRPQALAAAAELQVPVCLMHMRGAPATMQDSVDYQDVASEVGDFLEQRVNSCIAAGIARELLIADPGIGFGKLLQHNLQLINSLDALQQRLQLPLLVGISNKAMLGSITGAGVQDRLPATIATSALLAYWGVKIIRVHNVAANLQAIKVGWALRQARAAQ